MTPPNRSTFININGQNLFVASQNLYPDRPTLVFLHDSLGCVKLWRNFPEKLAAATRCNVMVYDRLGYGLSDPMPATARPTNYLELETVVLNKLLATLAVNQAILFGHSDGGSIALMAASKYPEKIKAVMVEAAHIFVEDITLKGIYAAMEAYKTTNLPERLQKYHGNKADTIFKAWTGTWTRLDFRAWNMAHFLPGITCPLLFIQGAADEYGTLQQVEKTVAKVSGKAESYIILNVGHTPHQEVPEQVLIKSAEFINQLLSGKTPCC